MVVSVFQPIFLLHAHVHRWAETPVDEKREKQGGEGVGTRGVHGHKSNVGMPVSTIQL